MFSLEDLGKMQEIMAQFNSTSKNNSGKDGKDSKNNIKDKKDCINLTPSQLLVIAGFLSGALEVNSVLVNKNQDVEIVLTGTLRRKTQLEKIMEQVGKLPFEDVVKVIMDCSE